MWWRCQAEEQLSNLLPAVEAVDAIVRRTKEEAALFAEMKDEHAQLGDMEQKLTAKIQQRYYLNTRTDRQCRTDISFSRAIRCAVLTQQEQG
eukprot:1418411-Rhodomonas_salina.2